MDINVLKGRTELSSSRSFDSQERCELRLSYDMKNYADPGGCYPPHPSASADNILLDLNNSSYHTQPHPIIANYVNTFARMESGCTFRLGFTCFKKTKVLHFKLISQDILLYRVSFQ